MRKLIINTRGQGLKTSQAYIAHIKKVTGIGLPEAAMLPKELHIGGRHDFISRNAVLRTLQAPSEVISKETVHEIVAALPNEDSVVLAGKDHLLSSWVAATGKKCKVAYPLKQEQLQNEPEYGDDVERKHYEFAKMNIVQECVKGNDLKGLTDPIARVLHTENKVLGKMPGLATRRILAVSSTTAASFAHRVVTMDVAAAAASTKNVTLNYSFIGQTSIDSAYITENELPIVAEGHKDALVTPFVGFRSRIEMILAKLSAKDALFTGSGRKYQLIDGPGNILKQLDNGDKVYVYNISINFTELSAQKGWGAWLTAARVLQKECPPGVPSSISVGVTVRNVQSEEGIQLQPRDVEDMVQRMLGHIPGMDASTARSVFGDPLTKAMAVKNSAEVKAELTLYNEEVLDAYNRWKALLGDCMDATAEEITRAQEILAAVLRTIPADFADLELANSILEEAGEKLKEAITDLINDVDMDELEAQLRAVAKDRIERVPSVPIFATPAYHAAISEEYQQRLINIDEVVHSTAHREWAHSLLEEVLGMISKDCNDVDMAIEVLTNATLGIISEYTEEFTPEQRALTSRSVLDAASARLEAAE